MCTDVVNGRSQVEGEIRAKARAGVPQKYFHVQGGGQFAYNDHLSKLTGSEPLPLWREYRPIHHIDGLILTALDCTLPHRAAAYTLRLVSGRTVPDFELGFSHASCTHSNLQMLPRNAPI